MLIHFFCLYIFTILIPFYASSDECDCPPVAFEFSEDYIDIATSIELRTQQYTLNKYEKIILLSPYRTGSTYIYNILRYLFENNEHKYSPHWGQDHELRKVCKHHSLNFDNDNSFFFITIRNPLDSCVSLYRVLSESHSNNSSEKISIIDIVEQQVSLLYEVDSVFQFYQNFHILYYEDFIDNLDYIYEVIETSLAIKIDNFDKEFLKKVMNRENVIANIKKFPTFNESDPSSLLHGNHIQLCPSEDINGKATLAAILEELKKHRTIIEKWGYAHIFEHHS